MAGIYYLADTNILLRLTKSNDPELPLVRRAVRVQRYFPTAWIEAPAQVPNCFQSQNKRRRWLAGTQIEEASWRRLGKRNRLCGDFGKLL